MSKKLITALLIFIILLGAFGYINLIYLKDSKSPVTPTKMTTANSEKTASLSLQPNPYTSPSNQPASINLAIEGVLPDSGRKLIQIELAYSPTSIFGINLTPGEYLINPQTTLNNIDLRTGRISYALSGETNMSDTRSSIVARINFTAVSYGAMKETEIQFLPKTFMRIEDEAVKISSMSGTKIIIQPAVLDFPPASGGATLNSKL